MSDSLRQTTGGDVIQSRQLARQLGINKTQLAQALGLPTESFYHDDRERAHAVQTSLRDLIEIIDRAQPGAGSTRKAFAWYRSQPLPSFDNRTAENLVKENKAEAVKAYLARINDGGYA